MWLTMADVGSGKKPRATSFRFNDTHRIGERSTPFVELDGSKRPAPFYSFTATGMASTDPQLTIRMPI